MQIVKKFWKSGESYFVKQVLLLILSFAFSVLCVGFSIHDENGKIDPEWFTYLATLHIGLMLTFREVWLASNFGVTVREAYGGQFEWRSKTNYAGNDFAWDDLDDDNVVLGDLVGRKFDWGSMTVADDKKLFFNSSTENMGELDLKKLRKPLDNQFENQKSLKAFVLILKEFPPEGNLIPVNKWKIKHTYIHIKNENVQQKRKEARQGRVDGRTYLNLRGFEGERNFRIFDNFRVVSYNDELRLAIEPKSFEEEEVLERGPQNAQKMAEKLKEIGDLEDGKSILQRIHEQSMQDNKLDFFEKEDVDQDESPFENRKLLSKLVAKYEVTEQGVLAYLFNTKRLRYAVVFTIFAIGMTAIAAIYLNLDFRIIQAVITGIVAFYVSFAMILCDYVGAKFSPRSLFTGILVLKPGNEPQDSILAAAEDFQDKIEKHWACYMSDASGLLVLPPAETLTVLKQRWSFKWSKQESKILAFKDQSYYEVELRSSKKHPLPEWRGVRPLWHIEATDPVAVEDPDKLESLAVKRGLYFS